MSTDQDLISLRFRSDIFGSSSFSFSSQKSEGKNFSVVVFDPIPSEFLGHKLSTHSPCSKEVSSQAVWLSVGVQVYLGTRLSHEGSDGNYTRMKRSHCPPAIAVFLHQGLEMFLQGGT